MGRHRPGDATSFGSAAASAATVLPASMKFEHAHEAVK